MASLFPPFLRGLAAQLRKSIAHFQRWGENKTEKKTNIEKNDEDDDEVDAKFSNKSLYIMQSISVFHTIQEM